MTPNALTDRLTAIESAMRRALDIASSGPAGDVNPQVGCVILAPDDRIVAEGWHMGQGTQHAETNAISHLPDTWLEHAGELTAVVTLEPCNHTGTTGPCADALLDAGIGSVVYALNDPGAHSSGGAEKLRLAGIAVLGGVLETEARILLAPWLAKQQTVPSTSSAPALPNRPRIIAKWAQTLDGRAAAHDGTSQWITGPEARQHVHAERALADAILVGTGTVIADDPSLTARGTDGELLVDAALQPCPIVVGEREIPAGSKVLSHPALEARELAGPIRLSGKNLKKQLGSLGMLGIRTVYVEGGPAIVSALLREGLVDELHVYNAPKLLGGERVAIRDLGIETIDDALHLSVTGVARLGADVLIVASSAPHTPEGGTA